MSTYKDCQNFLNNRSNLKMDIRDDTIGDACLSASNASPPDFDFNLPCRFFKSSFARSLSLNNASNNGSSNQCKSLDYDMRSKNGSNSNNKLSCLKRDMTVVPAVPPLPQRHSSQAGSFYQKNEAKTTNEQKQVYSELANTALNEEEKPPALPARRPLSLHNLTLSQNSSVHECKINAEHKFQQNVLTQLRQQTYKQAANNSSNNSIVSVNGNNNNNTNNDYNNKKYTDHAAGLQLSPQQPNLNQMHQPHHFTASRNKNANNCCTSISVNNNSTNKIVLRRNNNNNNHIVWPNQQQNVDQDFTIRTFDQVDEDIESDELNSNYHNTATKLSSANDYNNHFHISQQILHVIPTINMHSNQQQQQQQYQQQQHHHQQQQHQMSSYEILNDNTTNVEAVVLQNQVDTLQWQLKQVETSCDMYRAVMEEVARFLERYQSQKQLQQQQQQLQQQQQIATQKHNNNNNKLEQIPRSKSLFQVYIAGGHEKSTNGNNDLDDTSTCLKSTTATSASYLRARSSTNLIDLKQQQSSTSFNSKSKDHHSFETDLAPSQSYSGFKDFTWRRSPRKSDSRLNNTKDDVEEKLNQEAFRLLRTIQNLLNTSQNQPDLAHYRNSLESTTELQMGRLSKAMSTTSVMTLPGQPMHNSTSLTIGVDSADSVTADSSNTSPTTTTANNAASNNLAPEMLFLRSANMRDSRLSLRSSTDSSVHSTSSATSSVSSKVETDEEPSTPFRSPPNTLTHKQHHNLAGSSTEDESGFSSISSFPDIGVPLSSTILPNTSNPNKDRFIGKDSLKANEKDSQSSDSRNSTLKANVVGLPLNSSQDMSHRWDSPSKTYHNASNKFQRFSALTNEDSNTVLWV